MSRQTKTARARAEEALAIAQRRVARLEAEKAKHTKALRDVQAELGQASTRLAYVAANPDLPQERPPKATISAGPVAT